MHRTVVSIGASAIAACFAVVAGDCIAAAQRTFVASTGNDANPCSRASPYRSFAVAIAQTLSGGEVIVVDSAGYGAVTITQPVSIVAPPGIYAGISASIASAGITVNAGSDKVTLRGLALNSVGASVGIDYQSGSALYVDHVTVTNFASVGLRANVAATSTLFISDSVFRDNGTGASLTASSGVLTAAIEGSAFENNATGLSFVDDTVGAVRTSLFTGNDHGVVIGPLTGGKTDNVELSECTMRGNTSAGVTLGSTSFTSATARIVSSLISGGAYGIVVQLSATNSAYVSDSTITHNATGLGIFAGATIVSGGDNRLVGNTTNGSSSSTLSKQ